MTSREDSASIKRFKNESFEVVDFTVNYEPPFEDYGEETHEQKYSFPWAMKSDSQTKVKLMDKGKHQDINTPKKEATPERVINLMSLVMRLEQKVDNTMDVVDALKKKETTKNKNCRPLLNRKKVGMKIMLILLRIKVFNLRWWKRLFKFVS
jgi:hypothetical protein